MIIEGLASFHTFLQIFKMIEKKKINFNTLILLLFFFIPLGCGKIIEQNGVPTDNEILTKLNIGKTTKSQVRKKLGEPLMIDNQNQVTWIYFSQKIEKFAFFEPKLSSREVILLTFKNNTLTNKETFSQKDSNIIDISSKKVISGGRKLTVLQQIFGNIGNFSSQSFQQN